MSCTFEQFWHWRLEKSFIHASLSSLATLSPCQISNVSSADASSLLPQLKRGSSAGPYGLPPDCLKLCHREIAPVISEMLNSSLIQCKIPDNWRNVRITPIPKYSFVNSAPIKYHLIAIAPTLCKLFQKVILNFLSPTLDAVFDPI